ncbi:MAG: TonB-dependent receptor [Bacteroidota bacterium]
MRKQLGLVALMLLVLGCQYLFAQDQECTVTGYVNEAINGEQLAGAHVYTSDLSYGVTTNTYGFFSLTLPCSSEESNVVLIASFVGFEQQQLELTLPVDELITVKLKPALKFQEVEVMGNRLERVDRSTQMSVTSISNQRITNTPTLLGETDVLKTLQLLPGVQGGMEGTSGMHVRGGSPDQNLILLDGVPVYNAYHLFGLFSIFNSDAVNRVQLSKGGFPARYGGRLSSVVEVDMKEGNMQDYEGKASIGLIASRFTIEGPIIKDKASFIFSARRTYLDLLARPFIKSQNTDDYETKAGYYFVDLTGKLNYKINKYNRIYLSGYLGRDKFYFHQTDNYAEEVIMDNYRYGMDLGWGNYTSTFRWNSILSEKLFSNVTIAHSNYRFDMGAYDHLEYQISDDDPIVKSKTEVQYYSNVSEWRGRWNLDYSPNANHSAKLGIEGISNTFRPEVLSLDANNTRSIGISDTTLGNEYIASTITLGSWIEDDWEITDDLSVNLGLRYSMLKTGDKLFHDLQPRVSGRYQFREFWAVKASYARTQQNVHLLTSSAFSLPTDLWMPSTEKVPPEQARQLAAGVAGVILDQQYQVEIEGYYKWYDNLIEYREGVQFANVATNWERKVETGGDGWAYGVEFLIRKRQGRLTGWLGYSLSWSERKFKEINFGNSFPYQYDRRHNIKLTGSYQINDHIDATASWVFQSGSPITMSLASYDAINTDGTIPDEESYWYGEMRVDYYGERNSVRMPAYHRLDLGINFHKEKKRGTRTWTLGVRNAYNQHNPFFMYTDRYESKPVVKQVSILPILPMATYKFDF